MTEFKHTQGPWTARANGAQWVVDAGRKQRVASINTALMGQEANARLIAAAPDLLAAAEAMIARWPNDQASHSPLYDEANALRSAIDKATGAA